VLAVHRGRTAPAPAGVAGLWCDRHDVPGLRGSLAEFEPDAVVDHVAYSAADVSAALLALPASVKRYVLVSSAVVYGRARDRPYTEDDPPRPADTAARGKRAAERRTLARAPGPVCLRLGGLYGPGHAPMTPVGRDPTLFSRSRRERPVEVPRGAQPLQPWFSADHAQVVLAVLTAASPPRLLNAAGPERLDWPALLGAWAAAHGAPAPRCVPVEPRSLRARAPGWMRPFLGALWSPPLLDTTRLAALFDGRPPATPFAEGTRRTAAESRRGRLDRRGAQSPH